MNNNNNLINFLFFIISLEKVRTDEYVIPSLKIEAFYPKGLSISIPDDSNNKIKLFALHANINRSINFEEGEINGEVRIPNNDGFFTINDPNINLKKGDTLYYWFFIQHDQTQHTVLGKTFEIKELKIYKNVSNCSTSKTKINNNELLLCKGDLIFEDNFEGNSLDLSKWKIEQRIPTYEGPEYEFNSYLNNAENVFVKNSMLFLKPIPHQKEEDVRGKLDLRNSCTSGTGQNNMSSSECYYEQTTVFLLPPVKSARIFMKKSFKFGKIQIKCKLPTGDWIYPIIQLEPVDIINNTLPVIKIAYARGNKNFHGDDVNSNLGSTLLFGGPIFDYNEPKKSIFLRSVRSETSYSENFHTYEVEWSSDKISFSVDNSLYGTVKTEEIVSYSDFNLENNQMQFKLSLGVAVGSLTNFPDDFQSGNQPKPWKNTDRDVLLKFFNARNIWYKTWAEDDSALLVDFVKIWAV